MLSAFAAAFLGVAQAPPPPGFLWAYPPGQVLQATHTIPGPVVQPETAMFRIHPLGRDK